MLQELKREEVVILSRGHEEITIKKNLMKNDDIKIYHVDYDGGLSSVGSIKLSLDEIIENLKSDNSVLLGVIDTLYDSKYGKYTESPIYKYDGEKFEFSLTRYGSIDDFSAVENLKFSFSNSKELEEWISKEKKGVLLKETILINKKIRSNNENDTILCIGDEFLPINSENIEKIKVFSNSKEADDYSDKMEEGMDTFNRDSFTGVMSLELFNKIINNDKDKIFKDNQSLKM